MDMREILTVMVKHDASDVYLTVGLPPVYRVQGVTQPLNTPPFDADQLERLAETAMNAQQRRDFGEWLEMNLALSY